MPLLFAAAAICTTVTTTAITVPSVDRPRDAIATWNEPSVTSGVSEFGRIPPKRILRVPMVYWPSGRGRPMPYAPEDEA
jgi:hypothetical protein